MPSSREARGAEVEPVAELPDVDRLIVDVDDLVAEANRAAAQGEVKATKKKQTDSEEFVQRAEELQQTYARLNVEDPFPVDKYVYKSVFAAVEAETGVARPEKIDASIEALRKVGGALRRLEAVEPKTDDLAAKASKLQETYTQLFDRVQTATLEALESVRKKHKGEASELEDHLRQLTESPLVRGIERAPNTPEAREAALKQEIVESLLRGVVESRLKPVETQVRDAKTQLAELTEAYAKAKPEFDKGGYSQRDVQDFAERFGFPGSRSGRYDRNQLEDDVKEKTYNLKNIIEKMEPAMQRDRLAFDTNRLILQETLKDEHDEDALREAMTELRNWLMVIQRAYDRGVATWNSTEQLALHDPLAKKILGHYQQYGAEMPKAYGVSGKRELPTLSPVEQIMGSSDGHYNRQGGKGYIESVWSRAFAEPRTPPDFFLRENTVDVLRGAYKDAQRRQADAELPEENEVVRTFYSGQAPFLNIRRAYRKIEKDLSDRDQFKGSTGADIEGLPEPLAEIGWKESRLGALVEPEQGVREADRAYATVLKQLSEPHVRAENVLDTKTPEGGFQVYTLGQAVDLLRRARRDAGLLVSELGRTKSASEKEKATSGDRVLGLQEEIARMQEQMERAGHAGGEREGRLTADLAHARKVLETERGESGNLKRGLQASEQVRRRALEDLQTALGKKAGMFGGDKELRAAVERAVAQLADKK